MKEGSNDWFSQQRRGPSSRHAGALAGERASLVIGRSETAIRIHLRHASFSLLLIANVPSVPTFASAQTRKLRVGVLASLSSSARSSRAGHEASSRGTGCSTSNSSSSSAAPSPIAVAGAASERLSTSSTSPPSRLVSTISPARARSRSSPAGRAEVPGFPLDAFLGDDQAERRCCRKTRATSGQAHRHQQVGSAPSSSAGRRGKNTSSRCPKYSRAAAVHRAISCRLCSGGAVAVLPATVASGAIRSGAARLLGWGSDEAPWQNRRGLRAGEGQERMRRRSENSSPPTKRLQAVPHQARRKGARRYRRAPLLRNHRATPTRSPRRSRRRRLRRAGRQLDPAECRASDRLVVRRTASSTEVLTEQVIDRVFVKD